MDGVSGVEEGMITGKEGGWKEIDIPDRHGPSNS